MSEKDVRPFLVILHYTRGPFYVFLLWKVFLGDGNTLDCWRRRKLYALLCKDMLPWANINNFEIVILIFRQIDDGLVAVEMTLKKNILMCSLLTYLPISNQNSHLENIFEIKSLSKNSFMNASNILFTLLLKAFLILL